MSGNCCSFWHHGFQPSWRFTANQHPEKCILGTGCTIAVYWSFVERWHIFGAVHSRTLRHDWHGYLSLQWYELSQDVPSRDADIWVAFDLFYVLVHLYSSS